MNIERPSGKNINVFNEYHYWFDGKRLLDTPMETLLRAQDIDLPFCLMWANENWSRRWDGSDKDVLISQNYRKEDDAALIADLARHMNDRRYIRLQGRPLLMIYRPGSIPDAKARIVTWRDIFKKSHGLDPILVMAQAFDDNDPTPFGMDGVIEFPPHKLTRSCTPIEDKLHILDEDMTARVYDYAELVEKALADPPPDFPRIRTVCPSWDNDPRRQGAGLVLHNASPALYERWLCETIVQAKNDPFFGETLVCINAWNEWAEGAYLEPDLHLGAACLNATARAVTGFESHNTVYRLLLIGHDAFPAGAQMLILAIGRTLRRNHGIDVGFVLLGGGDLLPRYREIGTVDILTPGTVASRERLGSLKTEGYSAAIMNSAASTRLAPDIASAGMTFSLLLHELPGMIRSHHLEAPLLTAQNLAGAVIVAGAQLTRLCPEAVIMPQGLYNTISFSEPDRQRVRLAYGIEDDALVVIGAGYGDIRKGFDLFLQLWHMIQSPVFAVPAQNGESRPIHFIWVGAIADTLMQSLSADLDAALSSRRFHLPGYVETIAPFLSAADLFVLTSREDPYPSVVLEALSSGLPCMAFARNGMIPDLLNELKREGDTRHAVIPPGDLPGVVRWITSHVPPRTVQADIRCANGDALKSRFSFDTYVKRLLTLTLPSLPSVSVVVLSYNYAHYLAARLATIFVQNCPVTEIIVIDDASHDGSVAVAEKTANDFNRSIRIVSQTRQSGSVFAQWQKAAEIAQGDWLWIAEADDLSEPDFLSELAGLIRQRPNLTMAFCDSRAIDRDGVEVYTDYKPYYRHHIGHDLDQDMVMDGTSFVRNALSSCNLIMNVSAALFKRTALLAALETSFHDLAALRVAGDWRLYIELLLQPGAQIAYCSTPLNIHRRHEHSVTGSLDPARHLEEITRIHELIAHRLYSEEDLLMRQKRYRAHVEVQFDLHPPPRRKRSRAS